MCQWHTLRSRSSDLASLAELVLARLISLADAGKICEAENELSDILESGSDPAFQIALMFYDHLNNYNDSFLEEHSFSREEIRQGVLDVAKRMGALYAAVAIMDEDPEAL